MHIAIYLPSLRGGGAERAMVALAHGLAARGLRIDLVLASAEGPYLSEVSAQVRVVDLGCKRVSLSLPRLVAYIRAERPQALVSALSHANVVAIAANMLAGDKARLVVSERSNLSASQRGERSWPQRVVHLLMKFLYKRADAIVAVSEGVANDLAAEIGIDRNRISVVYNPVVGDEMLRLASEAVEHPWFCLPSCPIVLAAGRLTQAKDFPTLLHAFARVRKRMPCKLIILGEGGLREHLEQLADELGVSRDVAFPGFVANPYSWMRQADVFVLSSRWEGLPNALIQAMACGTRVISTDCESGPREILEGGKWGRLVPVADPISLAQAIIGQLEASSSVDPSERGRWFSADNSVEGYLKALTGDGR